MLNAKDTVFISKFIADNLKGNAPISDLLNVLSQRIPINRCRCLLLRKNELDSGYSALDYNYQKFSTGSFTDALLKEQNWNYENSTSHCTVCQNKIQALIHSTTSYYEIHVQTDGLHAFKINFSDRLPHLKEIYSFCILIPRQKIKPSYYLMIQCLLPLFFNVMGQLFYSSDSQHILSGREIAVLECIKQGKGTKDISQLLNITERTVNFHVKNIYQKLQVTSRAQAVAVAIDHCIINSSASEQVPLTL